MFVWTRIVSTLLGTHIDITKFNGLFIRQREKAIGAILTLSLKTSLSVREYDKLYTKLTLHVDPCQIPHFSPS